MELLLLVDLQCQVPVEVYCARTQHERLRKALCQNQEIKRNRHVSNLADLINLDIKVVFSKRAQCNHFCLLDGEFALSWGRNQSVTFTQSA